MMLGIAASLMDHGVDETRIKFELFSGGQPGQLARVARPSETLVSETINATITIDGTARRVEMRPDQTILEAAIDAALDPPYACRAGVCSTCKCRVVTGEVDMIANHALEDYEVANGYILSCQSFPLTADISVEYEPH